MTPTEGQTTTEARVGMVDICGTAYVWTNSGLVGDIDDMRYATDEFGFLVEVPFSGRIEEFQEH